jgi:hypothetical protein
MAKKWIQEAIKKPGALRASLGVKEGQDIPAKKLATAAKKPGLMGQRARLAQTLKRLPRRHGGEGGSPKGGPKSCPCGF